MAWYYYFRPNRLGDVFTPSTQAKLTFVSRDKADRDLVDAIQTPGYQIIIYGYSGCGKSTLIFNRLRELKKRFIITRCEVGTTLEAILLSAFDSLDMYYVAERNSKITSKISTEAQQTYLGIAGKLAGELGNELGKTSKRIIPPQLTPGRLAELFGEANCSWIIEDFHKVPENEKMRLSQIMKIFMDVASTHRETKVYAIGAVGTAREVLDYDPELHNRVAEIEVPLMTENELLAIVEKGEKLLNVDFGKPLKEKIVSLSSGLASVCHHLCMNICRNNGIQKSIFFKRKFIEKDLDSALEKYVNEQSDSFKRIYDSAVKVDRKRTYENGKLILNAMIKLNKNELTHNEILIEIQKEEPTYRSSNLTTYLKRLASAPKDEILRYDEYANKFSFKNPFFRVYASMKFEKEKKEITVQEKERTEKLIDEKFSNIVISNQVNSINIGKYNVILGDNNSIQVNMDKPDNKKNDKD